MSSRPSAGARSSSALDDARAVADAVLYEGYLLYPYRASSGKNQVRWQWGTLGPPSAADGVGEPCRLATQCLLDGEASVAVHLRFLQLQRRHGPTTTWDEAVPHEVVVDHPGAFPVDIPGAEFADGDIVRTRRPLAGRIEVRTVPLDGGLVRLEIAVENTTPEHAADRDTASALSFLGTHLLLVATGARFVSLLEPPPEADAAAAACTQDRCWPVLAADDASIVLASPIILYDHPELAPESPGALFDATEIDEILILRVMTMTDAEKAEARATDPKAAAIIDRCDAMTEQDLQRLHGRLRSPHGQQVDDVPTWTDTGGKPPVSSFASTAGKPPVSSFASTAGKPPVSSFASTAGKPWWDPATDASVSPETDAVLVNGVPVAKGSRVRIRPRRRADAQDIFFADQEAIVTAVLSDVDGETHVAVVLVDDPAAELHDWYGRYLYFAPDEIEPEPDRAMTNQKEV